MFAINLDALLDISHKIDPLYGSYMTSDVGKSGVSSGVKRQPISYSP